MAERFPGVLRPIRGLVGLITPEQPLELQIVGRTLFHAALVGIGAGLLGCLFFAASELVEGVLLERLAGYETLHAAGERVWNVGGTDHLRWWLVVLVPACGALFAG